MTTTYAGIDEATGLHRWNVTDANGNAVGYNLTAQPPGPDGNPMPVPDWVTAS